MGMDKGVWGTANLEWQLGWASGPSGHSRYWRCRGQHSRTEVPRAKNNQACITSNPQQGREGGGKHDRAKTQKGDCVVKILLRHKEKHRQGQRETYLQQFLVKLKGKWKSFCCLYQCPCCCMRTYEFYFVIFHLFLFCKCEWEKHSTFPLWAKKLDLYLHMFPSHAISLSCYCHSYQTFIPSFPVAFIYLLNPYIHRCIIFTGKIFLDFF